MRFKICSSPPLSDLKAWFAVEPNEQTKTILDLKYDLLSRLHILRERQTKHGICLSMDGFELLDESPISILRDDDLVVIQLDTLSQIPLAKESIARVADKTQHATRDSHPTNCTTKRKRDETSSSESSDSSESSSESSTTSDSSSSGSSDTSSSDSESDPDSDPNTDEFRVNATSKLSAQPVPGGLAPLSKSNPPKAILPQAAPPGYGKPATRSRNLRRRRKRQHESEHNLEKSPPFGTSAANAIPLGEGVEYNDNVNDTIEDEFDVSAPSMAPKLMMLSFRNKNKKKGFKQLITKPLPQKIIFDSGNESVEVNTSTPPVPIMDQDIYGDISGAAPPLPRLIPPSERQHLPNNLFVTFVDVEEGLNPKKKKKTRHRSEQISFEQADAYDPQQDIALDYGYAHESSMVLEKPTNLMPASHSSKGPDIAYIEKHWPSFVRVVEKAQLQLETLVGWKALAVNPLTCTPEMLLTLGHVIEIDDVRVKVQLIHQPAQTSFGGILDESEGSSVEETFIWEDIFALDWKSIINV